MGNFHGSTADCEGDYYEFNIRPAGNHAYKTDERRQDTNTYLLRLVMQINEANKLRF